MVDGILVSDGRKMYSTEVDDVDHGYLLKKFTGEVILYDKALGARK